MLYIYTDKKQRWKFVIVPIRFQRFGWLTHEINAFNNIPEPQDVRITWYNKQSKDSLLLFESANNNNLRLSKSIDDDGRQRTDPILTD